MFRLEIKEEKEGEDKNLRFLPLIWNITLKIGEKKNEGLKNLNTILKESWMESTIPNAKKWPTKNKFEVRTNRGVANAWIGF